METSTSPLQHHVADEFLKGSPLAHSRFHFSLAMETNGPNSFAVEVKPT